MNYNEVLDHMWMPTSTTTESRGGIIGTDISASYLRLTARTSATFVIVDGNLLDMGQGDAGKVYIDGQNVNFDNKQSERYRKLEEKYGRETR